MRFIVAFDIGSLAWDYGSAIVLMKSGHDEPRLLEEVSVRDCYFRATVQRLQNLLEKYQQPEVVTWNQRCMRGPSGCWSDCANKSAAEWLKLHASGHIRSVTVYDRADVPRACKELRAHRCRHTDFDPLNDAENSLVPGREVLIALALKTAQVPLASTMLARAA